MAAQLSIFDCLIPVFFIILAISKIFHFEVWISKNPKFDVIAIVFSQKKVFASSISFSILCVHFSGQFFP